MSENKNYISREDEDKEVSLRDSEKAVGQLLPVILDAYGKPVDGLHRLESNPDWRTEQHPEIKTDEDYWKVRAHLNYVRRKSGEAKKEKKIIIEGLCEYYEKMGLKVVGDLDLAEPPNQDWGGTRRTNNEILNAIYKALEGAISPRLIREHIPDRFIHSYKPREAPLNPTTVVATIAKTEPDIDLETSEGLLKAAEALKKEAKKKAETEKTPEQLASEKAEKERKKLENDAEKERIKKEKAAEKERIKQEAESKKKEQKAIKDAEDERKKQEDESKRKKQQDIKDEEERKKQLIKEKEIREKAYQDAEKELGEKLRKEAEEKAMKDAKKQLTSEEQKKKNLVHISQATGENEWYTPQDYIEAAKLTMGSIDVDPASCEAANRIVRATKFYSVEDNGLIQKWGGTVWMNPPYSQPLITDFCNLLVKKFNDGEVKQACVLVNNATETVFYQNMLNYCSAVCFIKGRVKFIDKNGDSLGTPLQGQTILYFGDNPKYFAENFDYFGVILYATN